MKKVKEIHKKIKKIMSEIIHESHIYVTVANQVNRKAKRKRSQKW